MEKGLADAPKANVEARASWSAVEAVLRAGVVDTAVSRPTAQHPNICIIQIFSSIIRPIAIIAIFKLDPFPDISSHIVSPIRTNPLRIAVYRRRVTDIPSEIEQLITPTGLIPKKPSPVASSRRFLPLGLGRHQNHRYTSGSGDDFRF